MANMYKSPRSKISPVIESYPGESSIVPSSRSIGASITLVSVGQRHSPNFTVVSQQALSSRSGVDGDSTEPASDADAANMTKRRSEGHRNLTIIELTTVKLD